MAAEYRYAPLATRSTIRVIRIEKQRANNKIACVIRHVNRAKFKYEALSYVWGNPKPTRYVYLGNKGDQKCLFPLHENLWRFLNWAWDRRMYDRWIWTDRICLNQENEKEMAQQILSMGEIFHDAKQTLSWLDMSERDGEHMAYLQDCKEWNMDQYEVKGARRAVLRVVSNEYWGRVWMAQEVVRAKHVAVLIGSVELDFETLGRTRSELDLPTGLPIDMLYKQRCYSGQKRELWEILLWISEYGFECERPQDQVYGFLGLLAPSSDDKTPINPIEIDYNKPASEVILDALFVSEWPWKSDLDLIGKLFGRSGVVKEPIFDVLKKYLASDRTATRNKELALYTLQSCYALLEMLCTCECDGWENLGQVDFILNDFKQFHPDWSATLQETALVGGIRIVLGSKEESASMMEAWKNRQSHEAPTGPVWHCAEHMARGADSPEKGRWHDRFRRIRQNKRRTTPATQTPEGKHGGGDSPGRRQDYLTWFRERTRDRPWQKTEACRSFSNVTDGSYARPLLDPGRFAKLCADYVDGARCDGSIMCFEIAEQGFRLAWQLGDSEWAKAGHLFIHFRLPMTDGEGVEEEEEGKETKEEQEGV